MIDISSIAEKFIQKEREKKSPSAKLQNNILPNSNSFSSKNILDRNNFKFLYVIGKGGFGKVWKIQSKKTKAIYALKEMSKLKIIDKKSEKSINSEREFLSKLHHPFIVNMHYAFQDKQNLYLVMDILNGGDLRFHISRYHKFSEEQTRFFIANIIYSLQYIHSNNVIHRDIKPENLVLDEKGYVRITDFGIAKENMPDNSSETSGTPGYMAPEVMKAKNHSFAVDFFAVGVIGYEFMQGKRPYYGKNRKEIKEQMLSKQALITEETIAHGWSSESMDFINLLLQRKEDKRLGSHGGSKGAEELMKHLWLKYYPWNELKNKTLSAPFIPEPKDNFDKLYCESVDKISEETQLRYEEIYCSSHFKKVFLNFFYNEDEPEEKARKEKIEKERKELIEREKQKEIEEEKERERELEREKKIKEKERIIKKDNIEINQKFYNFNNKSSSNFYKIDKNLNNINQKKIPNPPQSVNISGKKIVLDKNKKKFNKGKKIKTLSYSNSTRDIYSDKINSKNINFNYNSNSQYNKKKINQIPINNINCNSNNKKQKSCINNIFTPPISKGSSSNTNININNFYLNNIFSSIYNNYMTNNNNNHINFYSKNNNGITRKFISQRSSSVIASKKNNSKINIFERKNNLKNNENNYNTKKQKYINNNNYIYKSYIPNRKINRIHDNFLKSPSNNDNYINKLKSNSVYEQNGSFRYK